MANSAGGSAAAGGWDFQSRVAAWFAVQILAEKQVTLPWDLPMDLTLDWLDCEADQSVDDLVIGSSTKGRFFIQAKRTLSISNLSGSQFGGVLKQFVNQYLNRRAGNKIQPQMDRLVIAVSSKCPQTVKEDLSDLLNKIRKLRKDQSLKDLRLSNASKSILKKVKRLVRKFWKDINKKFPEEKELIQLLKICFVQVFEVQHNQRDEIQARDTLKTEILKTNSSDKSAWKTLVIECLGFMKDRSSGDREYFQNCLLNSGLELKGTPSYRKDIETLKKFSQDSLELLKEHNEIVIENGPISLNRPVGDELKNEIEKRSILVIGEPGAGKSGVLYNLACRLKSERRDFVFIPIDQLGSSNAKSLKTEIGLEHDIPEIIENWPGSKTAFLIIDSLDSARGGSSEKLFRDFIVKIEKSSSRWNVVASVRKFDLRYGTLFQEQFIGQCNKKYFDPEFATIKHINIQLFSDQELDELKIQSQNFKLFFEKASGELRSLVKNPFNLRILAGLIQHGRISGDLDSVKTHIDLLDQYWKRRVIGSDGEGDSREHILTEICRSMTKSMTLKADRREISGKVESLQLDNLLKNNVIVEWSKSPKAKPNRYFLAFYHSTLFDFAVFRLLLKTDLESVAGMHNSEKDLGLIARQSFIYLYQQIWFDDPSRENFWNVILELYSSTKLTTIDKLIGLSVAADQSENINDFEFLVQCLKNKEHSKSIEQILRHFLGVITLNLEAIEDYTEKQLKSWFKLLAEISKNLSINLAYDLTNILKRICEIESLLNEPYLKEIGETARNLYNFLVESETDIDPLLACRALYFVTCTYGSSTVESKTLLDDTFKADRMKDVAYLESPQICKGINYVIKYDPNFAKRIFATVFDYVEKSDDETVLGNSQILRFNSNKKQEYESSHHHLTKSFDYFLQKSPINATEALLDVLDSYIKHTHSYGDKRQLVFNENSGYFIEDNCALWDDRDLFEVDDPVRMLGTFEKYIINLIAEKEEQIIDQILEKVVEKHSCAVVWKRIIEIAINSEDWFKNKIQPLILNPWILTSNNTTITAGNYLKSHFHSLSVSKRKETEQAIMNLPHVISPSDPKQLHKLRDRILGCLDQEKIEDKNIVELVESLKRDNDLPPNEPVISFRKTVEFGRGNIDVKPDENEDNGGEIYKLFSEVSDFTQKNRNSKPSLESSLKILPTLKALNLQISKHAPTDQYRIYQYTLAEAASLISLNEKVSEKKTLYKQLEAILLEASKSEYPRVDKENDFDEFSSFESNSPRIEAALGLVLIARFKNMVSEPVLEAIEKLSKDPVAAVRYQISNAIFVLYQSSPKLMWKIVDDRCFKESSYSVLHALLNGSVYKILFDEPEKALKAAKSIYEKLPSKINSTKRKDSIRKTRRASINIGLKLHIVLNNDQAGAWINSIVDSPKEKSSELSIITHFLSDYITYYFKEENEEVDQITVWNNSWILLNKIVKNICSTFSTLVKKDQNLSDEEKKMLNQIASTLDSISSVFVIVSGASVERTESNGNQNNHHSELFERKIEFLDKAEPNLKLLSSSGIRSVIHNVIQCYENMIDSAPTRVFKLITEAVRSGKEYGYQYELAADELVIKIIERYLAEIQDTFKDKPSRDDLVFVLNEFVEAGSPRARKVAYQLDKLFR